MAQKTDAQLTTLSNTVQNETTAAANSATRLGGLLNDLNDSKINNDKISTDIDADTGSDAKVPSVAAVEAFVASEVAGVGVGFKTYKAVLSQTGSNAPTASVKGNTLGGTPVFARSATGEYTMTLSGAFPADKTFISNPLRILPFLGTDFLQVWIQRNNDNQIAISTSSGPNGAGSPNDGVLAGTDIDIVVFD